MLLALVFVMVPSEVRVTHGYQARRLLFVGASTLLVNKAFLDGGFWVFAEDVLRTLDDQSCSSLQGELFLVFDVLRDQHVVHQTCRLNFGIKIPLWKLTLHKLCTRSMQRLLLPTVEHDLVQSLPQELLVKPAQ